MSGANHHAPRRRILQDENAIFSIRAGADDADGFWYPESESKLTRERFRILHCCCEHVKENRIDTAPQACA